MAAARDYYDVLGVSRAADREEIRRAFRRLARAHHPDVSGARPDTGERFRELVDAYRTLSRPATRRMYDRFGSSGRGADAAAAVDELARWLRTRRRPAEAEVVAEVSIKSGEAARGAVRTVLVAARWECAACRGSGAAFGCAVERCDACLGRGRLRTISELGEGRLLRIEACAACAGAGRRVSQPCPVCRGQGAVRGRRNVRIEIPPGTRDGEHLAVELGGRDAVVAVRIQPLPRGSAAVQVLAAVLLVPAIALLVTLLVS